MDTATKRLDPNIITADEYNNIRRFTSELPFSVDIIDEVAHIFRRHSMQSHYGPVYIHRHYDMPDNCMAVQFEIEDVQIMKMLPIADVPPEQRYGSSFKLMENGKFQAYEYSSNQPASIPDEFLDDLARFILKHQLADVFGISSVSIATTSATTEINLFGDKLSIALPSNEVPPEISVTPTVWNIGDDEKWRAMLYCGSSCGSCCGGGDATEHKEAIALALAKRGIVL